MRSWSCSLAVAAVLFAPGAWAADTPAALKKRPGEAEFKAVWPQAAAKQGVGGYAVMRCKVSPTGVVSGCAPIRERPQGMGFGQALVSLAPRFTVTPAKRNGQAIEGEVVLNADWFDFDKEPDWLRRPTQEDLLVVWPTEAWKRGQSGRAVITCMVSTQGAVFDCMAIQEYPLDAHFGEAAIALTPQFLMKPALKNGRPVPSAVTIPINFVMPPGVRPPSIAGTRKMANAAMTWPEAPTYADVVAAYPEKARTAKIGGRATLNCTLSAEGRLTRCETISEAPKGQGFASAGRDLAKKFRAHAKTSDGGSPKGIGVQLPITFDPAMLTGAVPVVGKPTWTQTPSLEETKAAFAKAKGLSGSARVVLQCVVKPEGSVGDCTVESETPPGHGLDEAAKAMAPTFRLSTWTAEGLPTVGSIVRIPIRYEAPTEPAKP